MLTVRERIKAARHKRGMSQAALGTALPRPVSHATISWIEGGTQRLTLDLILDLARTLDVPVSWLLAPILEDGDARD